MLQLHHTPFAIIDVVVRTPHFPFLTFFLSSVVSSSIRILIPSNAKCTTKEEEVSEIAGGKGERRSMMVPATTSTQVQVMDSNSSSSPRRDSLVMKDNGEAHDLSNLMPPPTYDEAKPATAGAGASPQASSPPPPRKMKDQRRRRSRTVTAQDPKLYPSAGDFPVELDLNGILSTSSSSSSSSSPTRSSLNDDEHIQNGSSRSSFRSRQSARSSVTPPYEQGDNSYYRGETDSRDTRRRRSPSGRRRIANVQEQPEREYYEHYEYDEPEEDYGRDRFQEEEYYYDYQPTRRQIDLTVQQDRWREHSSSPSPTYVLDNGINNSSSRRRRSYSRDDRHSIQEQDEDEEEPVQVDRLPRNQNSRQRPMEEKKKSMESSSLSKEKHSRVGHPSGSFLEEEGEESYRSYRAQYLKRRELVKRAERKKNGDGTPDVMSNTNQPDDDALSRVEPRTRRNSKSSSSSSSDEEEKIVEIMPGQFVPLRGSAETWDALQSGRITCTTCQYCRLSLVVIDDADMVMCPGCRIVSSVDNEMDGRGGGGLGLGMSLKDARYEIRRRASAGPGQES